MVSLKTLIKSQLPVGKVKKAKRIIIKVQIPAGNATITPPLGPLLGQYGVNIMDFCKDFNSKTQHIEKDVLLNILLYIEPDKSFSFIIRLPTIAYLLKQYLHQQFELNQLLDIDDLLCYIYDIAILHCSYYNKSINPELLQNYVICILGTFRSFQIKFKRVYY